MINNNKAVMKDSELQRVLLDAGIHPNEPYVRAAARAIEAAVLASADNPSTAGAETKLQAALQWLNSTPHGDNCFVSDHYPGDPGNRCNCGKDSLIQFLESK